MRIKCDEDTCCLLCLPGLPAPGPSQLSKSLAPKGQSILMCTGLGLSVTNGAVLWGFSTLGKYGGKGHQDCWFHRVEAPRLSKAQVSPGPPSSLYLGHPLPPRRRPV